LLIVSSIPTILYEVFGWHWLSIPWQSIAILGTAVAFVVGFKNNASYDRMWEARKANGAITNASRNWGMMIKDFITNKHTTMGLLNPWLRNIRDVYRLHKDELNVITDEEKRYNRLVELNDQEQCINLIKTPAIQTAHKDTGLLVHGWVFDIHTGKLIDLKIDFPKF
jgi:predicted membrane chloride channel (bestrophin family)